MGIEFLSRGAKQCYFVDSSQVSINTIKENLIKTKLNEQATVIKNNVLNVINKLQLNNVEFDYIFMDPPYKKRLEVDTLEKIYESNILRENGTIIVEHDTKTELDEKILGLELVDYRKYGRTSISFYRIGDV
ncbi:Ribosomal RNA small subunit methyltransferase D [Caldisalinibacter kiritimatiensis]|uniref:Ribosomal RNA small subunit methyltransferase D n=1 Tax=Caldisalinibacter kiritimatiensis TaxID=1304284 RepID=R1CW74_9FIRM|nr:Ribosomal RNA small subunit methyltransferase D [Caldisalinibacter kiritimatiensis]